jgi:hypothetical protein
VGLAIEKAFCVSPNLEEFAVPLSVLDTVALRRERADLNLPAGLVGVIVEEWAPGRFEVEFADLEGRTYAMAAIEAEDLLPLRHSLTEAA